MPHPLPIAVLISGGGRTLRNLMGHISEGALNAGIRLLISSNPNSPGLEFANAENIPTLVVPPREHPDPADFGEAIFGPCRAAGVQLVVMGGFLRYVPIPADFENRVINIHPALIPAFCGQGMYGHLVHEAVLAYGAKVSGCTVHFVDNEYDHGPVILQKTVPVLDGDTPDELAGRVFAAECEALPETINLIAAGRVRVEGRRVRVNDPTPR